ncbi:MAG: GAP family protein [Galactobacter sp.]
MDFLTGLPLPASLSILAVIDGTSVGTLLIPLFFLVAPGRPRLARILFYLAAISLFYLLVGVLFMLGIVNFIEVGRSFLAGDTGQYTLLVAGIVLFACGVLIGLRDSSRKKRAAAGDPDALHGGGRLLRWRERLLAPETSSAAVFAVAIAAGLAEIAGMLPYLIGMTMIADASLVMPQRFMLLAGYCFVMIIPALVLIVARVVLAGVVERPLRRFTDWMQRTGAENTSWILGIVGFLLFRSAASTLHLELPLIG